MDYQLTIFKNQFDNKTHRHLTVQSWSDFVDLLGGLSQKRGQKVVATIVVLLFLLLFIPRVLLDLIKMLFIGVVGLLLTLTIMLWIVQNLGWG